MAGDWIKMQGSLWTSPEVVRIMSATKADKCRVIGALFRVWCLFDEHTSDGYLSGYTTFLLDDEVRIEGFTDAMIMIGWMQDDAGQGLQAVDFNVHMSKSAKKRAQDTKRKQESRKMSASETDKSGTREEKRREDIKKNNKKEKSTRFIKPTPEEIQTYCDQRKNGLSGQNIFDHYEAGGWKRGKTPIKDWKACVRTWEQNQKPKFSTMNESQLCAEYEKRGWDSRGVRDRFQMIQRLEAAA